MEKESKNENQEGKKLSQVLEKQWSSEHPRITVYRYVFHWDCIFNYTCGFYKYSELWLGLANIANLVRNNFIFFWFMQFYNHHYIFTHTYALANHWYTLPTILDKIQKKQEI
jgi:hypothetical protein